MTFILAKTPKGRAVHRMRRIHGVKVCTCPRLNGASLSVVSEHESVEVWADELIARHPSTARVTGCAGCFPNGGAWALREARERLDRGSDA